VKAKRPTSKELLNILSKEYTSQQKLEHLITRGIRYFAEANSGNRIEYGVNEESKMEVIRGSDEMTQHSPIEMIRSDSEPDRASKVSLWTKD